MTVATTRSPASPRTTPGVSPNKSPHSRQKHNESASFAALLRDLGKLPRATARGASPQQKKALPETSDRASQGTNPTLGARAAQQPNVDRAPGEPGEESKREATHRPSHPAHDPLERSFAQSLQVGFAVPPPNQEPPRALIQLDPNLAEMIRKVAWGKSGTRSTLRLELGGRLEGAVLVLGAEPTSGVSVSLELPSDQDPALWQARLKQRLEARGLNLEALEVR